MEGALGTIGDRDLDGFDLSSHQQVVISRLLTYALLCDSGGRKCAVSGLLSEIFTQVFMIYTYLCPISYDLRPISLG